MKKYMTLLTSLCLTVLAFAGNDFLVKRFEESIGPGNEGRVEAFSRFINAASVNHKTDVVQQRLIGYRYNEWLEGDWSTEDTLRMTYGGTRGAAWVGNTVFDVFYDLAGDGAGVVNEQRITNTWDANDRLTSKVTENWVTSAFENYQKEVRTYDANGHLLTTTYSNWFSGGWANNLRNTFTYDANGNQLTFLQEQWTGGVWENKSLYNYTYNAANKITYMLAKKWVSGAWEDDFRDNNIYDAAGNNTLLTRETFTGTWQNTMRFTYTFNANNQETSYLYESGNGSGWDNVNKTERSYNAQQLQVSYTRYNWSAGAWLPILNQLSDYDANGNITYSTQQTWNGTAWVNYHRDDYTYDVDGNPNVTTHESWISSAWLVGSQTLYDYNSYGNPDHILDQSYENSMWSDYREAFYYYETYNAPSAISGVDNLSLCLFPNPATSALQVNFETTAVSAADLRILDLNGRILQSGNYPVANGSNELHLDVAELSAGLYVIEVTANGRSSRLRFVKQ